MRTKYDISDVVRERLQGRSFPEPNSGCTLYTGYLDPDGYGQIWVTDRHCGAHRIAYEVYRGPIDTGLSIDHLCRNRACINPCHLETVTTRVNLMRGVGLAATNSRKTECKRGHPFTPENTYTVNNGRGWRGCRICRSNYVRRHHPDKVDGPARRRSIVTVQNLNAQKTECKRGHPFSPDNTYLQPSGARTCRVCGRAARLAYRQRRKPDTIQGIE